MKKITALFVLISMIVCLITGNTETTVQASDYQEPAKGQKELLKNGDFEQIASNGGVTSWTVTANKWNEETGGSVVNDKVHSGKSAIKFTNAGARTDTMMTQKVKLIPGAKYQGSIWVNVASQGSGKIMFSGVIYGEDYNQISTIGNTFQDAKKNKWVQFIYKFEAPAQIISEADFRFRLYGGDGIVYFDDVSLYAVEVPKTPVVEATKKPDPILIVPEPVFKQPAAGQKELLTNKGFEDLNENGAGLKSWTPNGSKWGEETGVSVVNEPVYSGKSAIKITNDLLATDSHLTQKVRLVPGATYQASVWVNVESIGKAKLIYSLAYWANNFTKYIGGETTSKFNYTNRVGEWVQFVNHFEAIEMGDNEVEFRIRLYGGEGVVYFDDVSLYMIEAPPKIKFKTSEEFYYTELTTGFASASLNLKQYPEILGSKVDFKVLDGNTVLQEKKNASTLGDNLATFYFDLTSLKEQKEYTVEATLKDKNGTALETRSEAIQRLYPRPTALSEEGYLIRDGKPVSVTLAFTRPEPEDQPDSLKPLVEHGVTAYMQTTRPVENDNIGRSLDHAKANGLMVIVCLYPSMLPSGHPDNVEFTKYYVEKYKDHPALLGWAVLDEPSAYLKSPELEKLLGDSYKLIRSLDKRNPVYSVEATTHKLETVSKYVDILASDPYPWAANPITGRASLYLREAAEAVEYGKPTNTVVQVAELNGYFPTVNDVRHQYYQSLFEGVTMLGYYSFRLARPGSIPLNKTDNWDGMVEFGTKGEQEEAFNNFVYRKYPIFSESTDLSANAWWSAYVKGDAVYMTIINRDEVNRNAAARTVELPMKSDGGMVTINGFKAELIYGDGVKTIEGNGSTFSVPLEQNAAVVYKITPNNPTDFSSLKTTKFRDLGRHSWAAQQIRELESRGLIYGMTAISYRPGYKVTRGDFAAYLVRTLGLEATTTENFPDVIKTSRYAKEVSIGKELGILKGNPDGTFNPESEISRQDMMVICARGMRLVSKLSDKSNLNTVLSFGDKDNIADYALNDVAAMIEAGVIAGNPDGTINPTGNATRAEAAVIMYRLLNK